MGRVLADVAAYEEEPHHLIFTCLFSLSILCVSSYVELCTTYPVVLTVVQRRNIAMLMPKYDRSSITPENPTHLCHRWIPPSQHPDLKSWCLGCFWSYFFLVCRTHGHTYDFPFVGKRQHRNENTTYTTTHAFVYYHRKIMAIHDK